MEPLEVPASSEREAVSEVVALDLENHPSWKVVDTLLVDLVTLKGNGMRMRSTCGTSLHSWTAG